MSYAAKRFFLTAFLADADGGGVEKNLHCSSARRNSSSSSRVRARCSGFVGRLLDVVDAFVATLLLLPRRTLVAVSVADDSPASKYDLMMVGSFSGVLS